ncbi:MAG: thioredoxin-dependent thiol peroxidase [Bacteroidota bacterium]
MAEMPQIGEQAPEWAGIDQNGTSQKSPGYRGRWLALYFYPKDDTPGCTKQACNLRDNTSALTEAGVAVIGVSGDSLESHERFAEKYALPFPLVSDPDRSIQLAYGVYGEKSFYGKRIVGVKRTTFLIDPEGVVRHVFKRPKTAQHAEEILAKLDAL